MPNLSRPMVIHAKSIKTSLKTSPDPPRSSPVHSDLLCLLLCILFVCLIKVHTCFIFSPATAMFNYHDKS